MKAILPYEITKLFEIDKETGLIDVTKNYAYAIEENFKTLLKYFNDLISGDNIILGSIGTEELENLAITNAKIGNLEVNDAKIENISAVKITPAWDGGWQGSGVSGTYATRTHNLGYFPSSMQLFGGNAGLTQIYDESYYASMDISWCSKTQVRMYFLNNASHGLPPKYRIFLFK